MRVTTVSFDLTAWAERMGALRGEPWPIRQSDASRLLGMSESGYKTAETRNRTRPGWPCNATLAKLARMIEASETKGLAS